jgi:hypothetical protein
VAQFDASDAAVAHPLLDDFGGFGSFDECWIMHLDQDVEVAAKA